MGDVDDAFGGLAAALIAAGVPAVIANQFPISDTPAIEFAETFYTHIVGGAPVDAAVTAGRQRLFRVQNSEWATPVLYMRSRSGMVLRMQPHRARAVEAGAARSFTVFLAATSASMDGVRTGLADALRTLGVQVRGVEVIASEAGAPHDAEVRAHVSAADLTVHLLNTDPGAPLSAGQPLVAGMPNTLPLRQLVLATQ